MRQALRCPMRNKRKSQFYIRRLWRDETGEPLFDKPLGPYDSRTAAYDDLQKRYGTRPAWIEETD